MGLSGGVDSALAAALLQERGFDVVGCFLKVVIAGASCPWTEDLPMAHRVAAHLNIPLIVRDVSAEYERDVLEPMVAAYQRGETPNPDTTCNQYVKFDALAAVAREVGADRIATGHYARIVRRVGVDITSFHDRTNMQSDQFELWCGIDHVKDQSYFLWTLTQEQLAMCEFPIGEWHKEDVRAEAKRRGFPNWDRESTSGVCFLGPVSIAEFLERRQSTRYPRERYLVPSDATVVTTSGRILGTVPHAEALTIGQRVPIAGQPAPRYVVAVDCSTPGVEHTHRVVVSTTPDDPARYTKTITAGPPQWIGPPPALPFSCAVRIRHRQEPVPCTVSLVTRHSSLVTADIPLTGVAPGQAVVFTDGDRVLGGAVIARPCLANLCHH